MVRALEDVPRFQQATGNSQLFPGICELLAVAVIRAAGGGPLALWHNLGRMLTALGHELSEGCCRAETSVVDLLEELERARREEQKTASVRAK